MAKYRAALIGCGGKGRDHTNTLIKNELVDLVAFCDIREEALIWITKEGATWRSLPKVYGYWNAIYRRFGCKPMDVMACQPYTRIIRRCLSGRI